MEKLEEKGAVVDFNDPHVPVIRPSREYAHYAGKKSVDVGGGYDLILIATPHDEYKSMQLEAFGIPIVDTRNVARSGSPLIFRA
jgi:UDP-N-acetyl-D-glucosamine dehydrogenase